MSSKWLFYAGGTAAIVGVVGYCVWFDRKRRSDPHFRRRLREKRQESKFAPPPTFASPDEQQQYFMRELTNGETQMMQNKFGDAADHFVNAIFAVGNVQLVMQALQNAAPPQVIQMTLKKLAERKQQMKLASEKRSGGGQRSGSAAARTETMTGTSSLERAHFSGGKSGDSDSTADGGKQRPSGDGAASQPAMADLDVE